MQMDRCQSGHLYNSRKYDQCPYCDEDVLEENQNSQQQAQQEESSKSQAAAPAGEKTLAYWDEETERNPVVGWFVCIDGAEKGKDYKIRSEKNFIGRSEEMHINIQGDKRISRRNHAVVSYNPKERNFVLIPGADTTGIIYVNEEAIYAPTELSPYDVIQMGSSKFIFIALCGKHFEWEHEDI